MPGEWPKSISKLRYIPVLSTIRRQAGGTQACQFGVRVVRVDFVVHSCVVVMGRWSVCVSACQWLYPLASSYYYYYY